MRWRLLPWLAAALLSACTVGPDYRRPEIAMPDAWRIQQPQAEALANVAWWREFGDPVLERLIEEALHNNLDLQIAAARVDQFSGALRTTRSQFYPQIGYGGAASRNRSTERGPTPLPPGADPWYSLYEASLGASWQIDLFGRVRRESEAAQAAVLAAEQGRRGVVLSLVSGVAASYIVLRGLDRELEIARATARNFGETVKLFELRRQGGVVSQIELEQVRSQHLQALAAVPALERQVAAQENLMSILLGRNPGPVERGKAIDELSAPGIPAELPASLLERRPDILQAEQNLVAANAQIGVAKLLYYPTFSLTGVLGSASAALSDFLSSPSAVVQASAGLSGPLFTFGGIAGQIESAEAGERAAVAFYRQTVQNAFREANDALLATAKSREEAQAQAQRVTSLREYARLSRLRFDNGYASYLEVLYAENELFGAELRSVASRADHYTQIVNVYKAVGGGWMEEADRLAPKPLAGAPAQDGK